MPSRRYISSPVSIWSEVGYTQPEDANTIFCTPAWWQLLKTRPSRIMFVEHSTGWVSI